ncbi:hypothetical protein [Nannocystis pusilla]|uniref:hypothetical protein n=1 Tax=Nannocystis pusilla TaxID=889268 RepID=UPI003B7B0A19
MESPETSPPPPASAYDVLADRCDRGDGPACVEMAAQYRELGELPLAAAYARRACDLASPFGCAALARAFERGEGLQRDPAAATSLYVSACLGGHAPSCISAAAGLGEPDAGEFMRRAAAPSRCCARPAASRRSSASTRSTRPTWSSPWPSAGSSSATAIAARSRAS